MKRIAPLSLMLVASGCSLAPAYHPPSMAIPAAFKEAPGWVPAQPANDQPRGDWWAMFGDAELSRLEGQVAAHNQTVAGAVAAYDQAQAIVRQSRSALLPSVTANIGATRAGTLQSNGTPATTLTTSSSSTTTTTTTAGTRYSAGLGASWEPDLFGALRSGLNQSKASAEAAKASLGDVTLAAQAELANDYVQLRGMDAQIVAYQDTITGYQRAAQITQNRYNVGVAARSDVLQAQTTLQNAQAAATDLVRQRQVFEHAIAVLVGEAPANLTIVRTDWHPQVPSPPPVLPSVLLERRPDIASAERSVAAANAGIGIQRAAFFPDFSLNAGLNQNASTIGSLFSLGSSVWSLGLSGAMTLLDFGGRAAKVAQARGVFDQAAATYRQTVLTAFQQVEDGLSGAVLLAQEETQVQAASVAASRVEQITLNQYIGGIADYTAVVTAQATALDAKRSAITATVNRQMNAIALSQATGGGWSAK